MAAQSRLPVLLLTRPPEQSARFAQALLAEHPGLRVVISPLLVPRYLSPSLPDRAFSALILTSETGAEAARRIAAEGRALPKAAFCVSDRTTEAAQAAGFEATSAEGNAEALLKLILARKPAPPLLHLHGREVRGGLAERLNSAGIETVAAIAYEQNLQRLTPEAEALLRAGEPVLAPVFSPRSAQALADECARIGARALLTIAAISPAASAPFAGGDVLLAAHPDAAGLMQVMALRLASLNLPPSPH